MTLMKPGLYLKAGVSIERLERHTRRGLDTVYFIFIRHKLPLVITSTFEGTHRGGSLHYADQAFDTATPEADHDSIFRECKQTLGKDFDIVIEKDHWHFEYDPKG
jgi:hypothetical protein